MKQVEVFGVPSSGGRIVAAALAAATGIDVQHAHAGSHWKVARVDGSVLVHRSFYPALRSFMRRYGHRDATWREWCGCKHEDPFESYRLLRSRTLEAWHARPTLRRAVLAYEQFVDQPERSVKWLAMELGLEWRRDHGLEVYDGNERYDVEPD